MDKQKLDIICKELREYLLSDNQKIDKKEIERLFIENFRLNEFPIRPIRFLGSHKEGCLYVYNLTRDIALDIARDAAWGAALDTALGAAWNAAFDTARDTARDTAWNAAWGAARDTAWNAAWGAARDAAWGAASKNPFFKGYFELYKNGLFSFWVTKEEIVCVCNPKISRKGNLAHNDTKEAILWENGEKYYFLNGVQVTEEIVATPAEKLNPELLIKETNAEIRKEIIRKIGMNRILQKLQAKLLDTWREYELYRIENIDIEPVHILKMRCPSKGILYCLRTPPTVKTARESIQWVNNGIDPESFIKET